MYVIHMIPLPKKVYTCYKHFRVLICFIIQFDIIKSPAKFAGLLPYRKLPMKKPSLFIILLV